MTADVIGHAGVTGFVITGGQHGSFASVAHGPPVFSRGAGRTSPESGPPRPSGAGVATRPEPMRGFHSGNAHGRPRSAAVEGETRAERALALAMPVVWLLIGPPGLVVGAVAASLFGATSRRIVLLLGLGLLLAGLEWAIADTAGVLDREYDGLFALAAIYGNLIGWMLGIAVGVFARYLYVRFRVGAGSADPP